jgi:gluconate 2-dehydrogenase alpha chain
MKNHADVVVVGLGASGGIVASELAKAGAKVVALDKGPDYADADFALKHDEIRYFARGSMVPQMDTDPITWRAGEGQTATLLPWASGPLGLADPLHLPPSLGTGGGSNHWGGAAWRFRDAEFRMRSAIVERFGAKALPDGTDIVDWPLRYADLEPYYDRTESELGISGQAGNINGELMEGGNPFESPRRRGFPMPPLRQGPADLRFVEACRRLGFHPFPQAAAITSTEFKGRSGCVYCGFCHGYPCHVKAKTSTQVAVIPAGLASGNLEIRPYSRVYKVNRDETGERARGVSYYDADGQARELSANIVVLACYALENSRLLLLSGVNRNGMVGKYFMTHAYGWYAGLLSEWTNPFMAPLTAASVIADHTGELIPENDLGVLWGSVVTSWPGETQPIEGTRYAPESVPRWGKGLKDWMRENFRRLYSMYAQTSNFPSERYYCDLDPHIRDPFGHPALRITHDWTEHDKASVEFHLRIKRQIAKEMGLKPLWEEPTAPAFHLSTHEVGVHRMGVDPSRSVVDVYGETHESKNLFAIGGGQFPTYGGYNPTQTIMALAFLSTEELCKRG